MCVPRIHARIHRRIRQRVDSEEIGQAVFGNGVNVVRPFSHFFLSFKPVEWSAIMQPTARIIEASQRQNRGSDPYLWAFESMELDKSVFFTLSRLLPLPLSTTVLFNSSVILLRVRVELANDPRPANWCNFFSFFSRIECKFFLYQWNFLDRLISPYPNRWFELFFSNNFIFGLEV